MPHNLMLSVDTKPSEAASQIQEAFATGCSYLHVKRPNDGALATFYGAVARLLGEPADMKEDADGNKTGEKHTDIAYPWPFQSKSYSHSNTRQPFHTDGAYESEAPELVYFFCRHQAKHGGATVFIDNKQLVELIRLFDASLLVRLRTEPVLFSKGNDHKTRPIIGDADQLTWNWHRCDQQAELPKAFHNFLETVVWDGGIYDPVVLSPGHAVFFKDSACLHGRQSFLGTRWLVKGGIHLA